MEWYYPVIKSESSKSEAIELLYKELGNVRIIVKIRSINSVMQINRQSCNQDYQCAPNWIKNDLLEERIYKAKVGKKVST